MKNILSVLILLNFALSGYSQNDFGNPFAVSVSYFGDNSIHPGLKVAGYYNFERFEKSKERRFDKKQTKKGNKVKLKTYYGMASIGAYSHANNHNGLFANVGIGYERVTARQGWLLGYSLSAGYLYRDYKFETFELVDGEIETIGFAGSGGVVFSLAPHFGRDLSVKTSIPIKVQLKPIIQLMQYNHGFAPNAALELEFIYNL